MEALPLYTANPMEWLMKQARRLRFVAHWLDLCQVKREDRELRGMYKNGLEAAKKRNAPPSEY